MPQLELLERAAVFITHGGMNSVHEGLYFGVPLIVIPHQIEQLLNARCIASQGAARVLDGQITGRGVTPHALRASLSRVSSEPRYAEAAKRIGTLLQATGGYRHAADCLQAFAGGVPPPLR